MLVVEVEARRLRDLPGVASLFADAWDTRDEHLASLAERLRWALRERDCLTDLVTESLVLEMLGDTLRREQPDVRGARWLLRVREYLDAHALEGPSAAELAALTGVHPVHLARTFRRAFGCSMGEYARRMQVARALSLLKDESLSLSSIAYLAGFADQSHMTRRLRTHTGLTPLAWRRRQRCIS
jgi:AraC family transcriptional regulator